MTIKYKLLLPTVTIIVAIIISLFISEFAISYLSPQDRTGTWFIYSRYGYHLNKSGGCAKHQSGNRIVHYRFNNNHLRGGNIKQNIKHILVVGDSFTFGWLLNEKDTYIHHLQSYADHDLGPNILQFLNGGAGGWGTAHYLAFIEEYGEIISPQIIIVFLNTDDIGRSLKSKLYKIKNSSTLELEKDISHKDDALIFFKNFTKTLPFYQLLLENSHLLQLFRKSFFLINNSIRKGKLHSRYPNMTPSSIDLDVDPSVSQLFGKALFKRLKEWCDNHKAELIVFTTGYFYDNKNNSDPTIRFFNIAPDFLKKEGIKYYDISSEYFSQTKDNKTNYWISPSDSHPNEKGSQIIAESSWKRLKPLLQSMKQH